MHWPDFHCLALRRPLLRGAVACLAAAATVNCAAFGIGPSAEDLATRDFADRIRQWAGRELGQVVQTYERLFHTTVHEELTQEAYGCTDSVADCMKKPAGTPAAAAWLMQGVEWNDNPPFQLKAWTGMKLGCFNAVIQLPNSLPDCWIGIMGLHTQISYGVPHKWYGPGAPILLRSHFGDLQFLHSMAAVDGEPAEDTRKKIMQWAEFAYRVSAGDIRTGSRIASERDVGSVAAFFPKFGMDVGSLFIQGTKPNTPERVKEIAFGSLLHMVEDSFSRAHVDREHPRQVDGKWVPGAIRSFHSYAHQHHDKHSGADTQEALDKDEHTRQAVVQVVRDLKDARATGAADNSPDHGWSNVRKILLDTVYVLADPAAQAAPGTDFQWDPPTAQSSLH